MPSVLQRKSILNAVLISTLVLVASPFAFYAVERGMSFSSLDERAVSRFFHADKPTSTLALYVHMIAGGVITLLAPLQLLSAARRRWPYMHRVVGYTVAFCAMVTSVGGLWYIIAFGTVGGSVMNVGFGVYGGLMFVVTCQTIRHARARHLSHQLWAERLVILALASWLYRVHYGLWELAMQGAGTRPDFTGPFDVVQVFAFYLPYLALHAWVRRQR